MTPEMQIGSRRIGSQHPPLVIAEIGINHEGSFDKAVRRVEDARAAGCECVKFQCHVIGDEMIVPLHDNLGEYDRDNSGESGRGYRDNLGASRAESRVKPRLPSDLSLAELFLEVLKLKQGALATALLFCWRTGRRKRDRHLGRGFWAEPNAADVEVFLEAVQLEEVG